VEAEIGLPHVDGAIATARTADNVNPERLSSGSQFYITLGPQPFLDGQYTVFGQVVDGMDVVEAITVGDLIEEIVISEVAEPRRRSGKRTNCGTGPQVLTSMAADTVPDISGTDGPPLCA